ncbi:MAG: hypothetical protein IPL53_24220 [Ignavibacteria bacterium]|nr:hypothetical protein [Ignavibacteria bacterium]
MEFKINYAQEDCDDDDGGSESSKFAQGCDECYSGSSISEILVVTSEGIQVRNTEGKLIKTFMTGYTNLPSGMSANAEGKLFISDLSSGEISVFDKNGNLTGSFRSGINALGEIVADNMSNVYISEFEGSEIKKFDLHDNYLTSFYSKEKINLIALHPDNCNMFYTSDKGDLLSFNLCANTPLVSSFPPGILKKANSFKILSDGSILAAVGESIVRLSPEGKLIQSYDVQSHDHWSALDIDTDGESFWCADYCNSNVRRFNLTTGEEISYFNTGKGPGTVFRLVVKKADESKTKVSITNVTLDLKISSESLEPSPVKGESITVSLRKSTPPYQIIDYKKGILDADGNCSPLSFQM